MGAGLRCASAAWGLLAALLLAAPGALGQWGLGTCDDPPSFPFAVIARYSWCGYYVGCKVEYSCLPGYFRVPGKSNVLTCLNNLTWAGDSEFCVGRSCPQLQLQNGTVNATSFQFGAEATFSCDEGFMLIGATSVQCVLVKNRVEWNEKVPECKRIHCRPPPGITHGSHSGLSEEEFFFGSAVTYRCDQGFSLAGEASVRCVTKDNLTGEWSGPAPECKVRCPMPQVQSARMVSALDEKTWYNVNETIPFKCSPGYQFSSGSDESARERFHITCLADGSWTELPKCEKRSTSDECEVVPKHSEILDCDVPLKDMKNLLEIQKLYLEIEKLKQEMKLS